MGTFKTITEDARFQIEGVMHHPLSHQEAIDAKCREHECPVPADLTVEHDAEGERMRNSPIQDH